MPSRRTHKKSRAGCQNCKARKIKCDEIHPSCSNCVKHSIRCDFEDGTAKSPGKLRIGHHARKTSDTSSTPQAYTPGTPIPPTPTISLSSVPTTRSLLSDEQSVSSKYSGSSRALEMRLMHHYTALTAPTLAAVSSPETLNAWQIHVPDLAFEFPCLMDAVLAVSALHLSRLHPGDKALVRASHSYLGNALSQYSSVLMRGVDEDNAEAIFATSALIAFQSSSSRSVIDHQKSSNETGEISDTNNVAGPYHTSAYINNSTEDYTLPIQLFHSYQGVKAIVIACWKHLRSSSRLRPIINAQPALLLDLHPDRPQFFSYLLSDLAEELETIEENHRFETQGAYEHAVAYLNWSHQKPERGRILGFPATVSRRYVELIQAREPRALVIMACFFAMTKVVDEVWWLQGVAAAEVNGVMGLLPREWWPKMDWAVRVTSHVGEMDESTWGEGWKPGGGEGRREEGAVSVDEHIEILMQQMPDCD